MTANDAALAQFNEWMRGTLAYEKLSDEARAEADEYMLDYWQRMDALCEGSDA